jgi:hypothetical protein
MTATFTVTGIRVSHSWGAAERGTGGGYPFVTWNTVHGRVVLDRQQVSNTQAESGLLNTGARPGARAGLLTDAPLGLGDVEAHGAQMGKAGPLPEGVRKPPRPATAHDEGAA